MNGILYGVGVGPGDPELLTLKAVRLIEECDYIAIPSENKETCVSYQIAKKAVPAIETKHLLYLHMPMTKDKSVLQTAHMECAKKIEAVLKQGESVCFLTLGDPCIYSTYFYVAKLIAARNFQTKIISGIPSFCAAAASLNTSLGETNEPVTILPGSYEIEPFLSLPGTKIIMKSGKQMSAVKTALSHKNLKVSMVENCGMEGEQKYTSLEKIPNHAGYYSLIIAKQ